VIVGQWFRDRFKAAGGGGYATLSLENVTIQEDPLANTGGAFQSDMVKYTCVLGLKLELFKGDGRQAKVIQTSATVSRTVPDNLTVCEREKVCLDLVEQAINANDDALVQRMKAEWTEVLCTP
jgi:hypothetical protein